jgi:hypothetical protein
MNKATTAEHAVFRISAEDRGYAAYITDQEGRLLSPTLRNSTPPAGVLLFNPNGAGLYVAVEDLAAPADLLLRMHVQAGRMRLEMR